MAIIINGRGRVGVRTSSGGGGSTPSYLLDIYSGAAVAYSADTSFIFILHRRIDSCA
jgi:hypothetical protein